MHDMHVLIANDITHTCIHHAHARVLLSSVVLAYELMEKGREEGCIYLVCLNLLDYFFILLILIYYLNIISVKIIIYEKRGIFCMYDVIGQSLSCVWCIYVAMQIRLKDIL